jgi:hypothetical protein
MIKFPLKEEKQRRDASYFLTFLSEQCTKAIFHNSPQMRVINLRQLFHKFETFARNLEICDPIKRGKKLERLETCEC